MKSKKDRINEIAAYTTMAVVGVVSILALVATIQAIFGLI